LDVCHTFSFEEISPSEKLDESGAFSLYYDEIQPGDKVSFNITVKPKLSGLYDSTRAKIKYASSVLHYDDELRKGYSSSLGRIKIISHAEYKRKISYFVKEWIIFIVFYAVVTALPFHIWMTVSKKNSLIMEKKKLG
jgi:hypothetical protein